MSTIESTPADAAVDHHPAGHVSDPTAPRSPRGWQVGLERVFWVLATTAAWAVALESVFVLSLRLGRGSPMLPGPTLLGVAYLWILVLALVGLTGKRRRAYVISLALTLVLATVNAARMDVLMVPVAPSDVVYLSSPGFLLEMVGLKAAALGVIALVGTTLAVAALGRRVGRGMAPILRGEPGWVVWTLFRCVAVVLAGSLLWASIGFNQAGNVVRAAYDRVGAGWMPWDQADNYRVNGFVGGLLYNLPIDPMEQPGGYERGRVEEIADKWVAIAADADAGLAVDAADDVNVIVVLSESMGDPGQLDFLEMDRDPLLHSRRLMAEGGGNLLATYYGTGTSSMEFQVLTGQSAALFRPQVSSPYQQFVPDHETYPSLVGWLRHRGHEAVAVHPYTTQMYRRTEVYPTLGFTSLVDQDGMQESERLATDGYIADRSAYEEAVQQIKAHAEPTLVHLVTMQNHLPYDDLYSDPVEVDGVSDQAAGQIGQWARGLSVTDEQIPKFLAAVERTGEPTVVIHFGDHFPGIFDEGDIKAAGVAARQTPYFIWSNVEGAKLKPREIAGPTALAGMALDTLGAPKPPYLHLVSAVADEIGVLDGDSVITPEGERLSLTDLDAEQKELLDEFRLVQYDLSAGERWSMASLWGYSEG